MAKKMKIWPVFDWLVLLYYVSTRTPKLFSLLTLDTIKKPSDCAMTLFRASSCMTNSGWSLIFMALGPFSTSFLNKFAAVRVRFWSAHFVKRSGHPSLMSSMSTRSSRLCLFLFSEAVWRALFLALGRAFFFVLPMAGPINSVACQDHTLAIWGLSDGP